MYRIALNTAITLYRNTKRQPHTDKLDPLLFKVRAIDYDDTEEQQLALMYDAIKQLNDIEKALVFLYVGDKNYRELSDTRGISEINARGKMYCRNNIRKKICKPQSYIQIYQYGIV